MTTKHQEIYEPANICSIISELWKRAAPGLSKKELEWFKNSGKAAQISLKDFSSVFKAIGVGVVCDEKMELFSHSDVISRMFVFFSEYARCLEATVFVANAAAEQLCSKHLPEQ